MILFTLLVIAIVICAIVTIVALAVGNTVLAIVFGDLIVFLLIMYTIIKHFITKKKKNRKES